MAKFRNMRWVFEQGTHHRKAPAMDERAAAADGVAPFDAAAKDRAKRIAAAAGKPKTRDEGLKAIHAALHRKHFSDDRAAWEAYGSSRQRFYEWKPHCPENTIDQLMLASAPASAGISVPLPWRAYDLPEIPRSIFAPTGCEAEAEAYLEIEQRRYLQSLKDTARCLLPGRARL